MNTTWLTVRAWTLGLRGVLAELGAARLRWCVVCGRVGLRRWQPLCAAMPITWVCADWASCRHRQVLVLGGRPGPTPALGPDRPWRPGRTASPSCVLHGPQLLISGLPAHGAMLRRSWPPVLRSRPVIRPPSCRSWYAYGLTRPALDVVVMGGDRRPVGGG